MGQKLVLLRLLAPIEMLNNMTEIAVIGGGAAGFFAAISCKNHHPESSVTIYEKFDKLLSKVKVSGGGRCNVTNACFSISQLVKNYPRGEKQLKKIFTQFNTNDTVQWFENRGVQLKTEADGRMFPVTNNSQTIINCLMQEAHKLGVSIQLQQPIFAIEKEANNFKLTLKDKIIYPNKIIIATGGSPKLEGFNWLIKLGHIIEHPVPSLFTFNMPHESITALMGVAVNPVAVRVQGTKFKNEGALLITHWGISGPAILKLSAWGARTLSELNYKFIISINWLGVFTEDETNKILINEIETHPKRKICNENPFALPNRLWLFLLSKLEINPEIILGELGKKNLNRLLNALLYHYFLYFSPIYCSIVTCFGINYWTNSY